jgi:hypothetical protein
VLVLLVHPVNHAETRIAKAAMARRHLGEAFMGGAPLNRKGTPEQAISDAPLWWKAASGLGLEWAGSGETIKEAVSC